MHDPRLGRFFSVDPLDKKYAWNSPYSFSSNRVIDSRELEGLEARYTMTNREDGTKVYDVVVDMTVINNSFNSYIYNLDIPSLATAIEQEMEYTYFGSDENVFINISFNLDVYDQFDPNRFTKIPNNTLTLEFVDRVVDKATGELRPIRTAGRAGDELGNSIGDTQINTIQVKIRNNLQQVVRTAVHEIGHVLGLRHPFEEFHKDTQGNLKEEGDKKAIISVKGNENNIMRQSQFSTGTWINTIQLIKIIEEIDNDRPVKDEKGNIIEYKNEEDK